LQNSMKAALLYGIKDLRVEDIPKPEVGTGEVLVRVRAATTCGTDLKIFQRGYLEKVIKLPTVFGHEWAGEVIEIGKGVDWPIKGTRVRAGNSAPCFRCRMCQKGNYNLCENMLWLWGAYAEFIKIPSRMVIVNTQEIPSHIQFEEAAITEPLACVLHGAEEAKIKLGDTVTVIGAGPIGLLHLMVAKKMGAEKVIIIDLVDERLTVAEKLGADAIINAGIEDPVEKVKALTGNYGADVVIEAIGHAATWEQAVKMVRKGGTVLEFGGPPPGTKTTIDTEFIHYGEVKLLGTFHAHPAHFRKALKLIESQDINVKELITRKMKLEEIGEAFEILATSKSDIKIAIIP